MKVALIGFAVENQSALRYFQQKGDEVTICDQNPSINVPAGVASRLGPDYLDNLDQFDVVVRTVGMHPDLILQQNPSIADKLTTAINLFFENCKTPIIGVTGTKGKGTTSTLIAKTLEAAGKQVVLAGNMGEPMLDALQQASQADYVVLELSSFQLIDCRYSPHIAVCLMVVPEHLNWHHSLEEYIAAKQQLFRHQTTSDVAIFNRLSDLSQKVINVSRGVKKSYEVPLLGMEPASRTDAYIMNDTIYMNEVQVCKISEVALLGRHNLENICAAIVATWDITGQNTVAITSIVKTFTGLEHRLELVRELDGVKYYNDSFGTTPETAIVAIQAFEQPKVVILGGSSKDASFDNLARLLATSNIRQVILVGNTANPEHPSAAPELEHSLHAAGVTAITSLIKDGPTPMDEIVAAARNAAQTGDVVLLSTACASFDIFDNYKQRGEQFKQAVQALV